MKKVLDAYKNKLPAIGGANDLRHNSATIISVTEALDTEVVDILVDKAEQSVKIRVDGKGRGPAWKFWKDHFEASTGSSYLLTTCPADKCIIRCSTSRNPTFLKILGVISVDTVSGNTRWIPFQMIEKFAGSTNMSPMPTIYTGRMNFDMLKEMVNKPILGVKRDGIYVVPHDMPIKYIKLSVNVDEAALKPVVVQDMTIMNNLAEEFATRVFDESQLKSSNMDLALLIRETLKRASESLLTMEYTDRTIQEAGADKLEAEKILKQAVVDRIERLAKKYV